MSSSYHTRNAWFLLFVGIGAWTLSLLPVVAEDGSSTTWGQEVVAPVVQEVEEVEIHQPSVLYDTIGSDVANAATTTTHATNVSQHISGGLKKQEEGAFVLKYDSDILTYLNPEWLPKEGWLPGISRNLQDGNLVVIEDAFDEDFAEWVYQELHRDDLNLTLNVGANDDGFSFYHHNIHQENFTSKLWQVYDLFDHPKSKAFMTELTGRDCNGENITASGSWYHKGDHSLPHTDYFGDRSVAFVWHLSKNWDPSWGGALYWADAHVHKNPFVHASFNTLSVFSVTPRTSHFVTTVSHRSEGKRLTFSGWYLSDWEPSLDMPLEDIQVHEFSTLTFEQAETIRDMDLDEVGDDTERRSKLEKLQEDIATFIGTEIWSDKIYYA